MVSEVRSLERVRVYLDVIQKADGMPELFTAWTDGRRWNGWATPYFEKEEADRLVTEFNKRPEGTTARYDTGRDAYVFADDEMDPPEETYGGIQVEGRTLYPIGAAVWCWSAEGDFPE